jgi:hypothetical protein
MNKSAIPNGLDRTLPRSLLTRRKGQRKIPPAKIRVTY